VGTAAVSVGAASAGVRPPVATADRRIDTGHIKLSWLIRLHWGGIVGQGLAIVAARWVIGIRIPLGILLPLVGVEVIGNVALMLWQRSVPTVREALIAVAMLVDTLFLTVLLAFSGGHLNPFSTLYLVNVALATVLLDAFWAWTMFAASLVMFSVLFATQHIQGLQVFSSFDPRRVMALHMEGMWMSFVVAGAFIVYIVHRVQVAVTAVYQALAEERSLSARKDKVASLATLAAGAAHELSTPLSTIAVVVKELQRAAHRIGLPESVTQDLTLIREQVARCRDILHHMSAQAGENAGEPFVAMPLARWLEGTLGHLPDRARIELHAEADLETNAVAGPPRGLTRALRGLLKNALQASPPGSAVILRLRIEGGYVVAEVIDRGCGMPGEILSRAGEPFFTTKVPGEGMGLGLFLSQTLAEQLGGGLDLRSTPGSGTTATLRLPKSNQPRSEP